MAEVDAGFVEVGIEAERTADLTTGAEFVSEPVQSVAQRRDGLGAIRPPGDGPGEYVARLRIESVPVERTPHRQHEFRIVAEPHLFDLAEVAQGARLLLSDKERAALQAKLAKSDGRKQRKAPRAPAPQAATSNAGGFAQLERDYSYSPEGKRDPFRDFKWERPDRLQLTEITTPLEQYDLGQLSIVAVVWKTGNARALPAPVLSGRVM